MVDLKFLIPAPPPCPDNAFQMIGRYFGSRRGLFVLGAVIIILGVAFNWSWLLALGIASLLLSALPCLAVCALGLCMHKMTGRSDNGD